jgi:surfactin synthase thioesterase subunit
LSVDPAFSKGVQHLVPDHTDETWIRRFHPRPDGDVRLVCLPHAGGSASFFFPLSQSMPSFVDVLTVQYPGRQDRRREPAVDNMPELVDRVFTALVPWTDRPLALFGHSMGGTLAFELARRLEKELGTVAAGLFVSACAAPSAPRRREKVHLRDDDGIIAELGSLSGTDPKVLADDEILTMVLPAVRADYRTAETYVYEPGGVLHCPVMALTGDSDPRVGANEAKAWGEVTEGSFVRRTFPGGHFYLTDCRSEVIQAVAGHLRERCS